MASSDIIVCGTTFPERKPVRQTDPISDEEAYLPIYVVAESQFPGLLHPEVLLTLPADAPPDAQGYELVVMYPEDYHEQPDEPWQFCGLVPLEPAVAEYDDDVTPEDLARYRAEEPEEYWLPETFPCPYCADGGAVDLVDDGETVSRGYLCGGCGAALLLQSRLPIVNAAALLALPLTVETE